MPRRLRPDEEDLWRRVTASATPLRADQPQAPAREHRKALISQDRQPIPNFRIGEAVLPSVRPDPISRRQSLRIDRRTQRELSRGKRPPEASIDLHGMTLEQANVALSRFILASFATGRRLVLVITGKGKAGEVAWDAQRGVLRRQVPEWLAASPLGSVVQEILPAHRSHGGSGAYYVVLRRN